jgi:molybdopterin synthase catalytic subunit
MALAEYMTEKNLVSMDYLIQMEAMRMGKQNYFTHVRRGILEAVKEDGIIKAVKEQFKAYKLDEQGFNILDRSTGEVLAYDKWFKFAMHRTGELKPTQNVVKAFLTYQRTFLKKQALDETTPLIDIYAHALTPKGMTKKGLLLHGNLIKFVKEWINTQKGRHITLIAKQNGKIDAALRAIKMFTSLRDLAFNIPVSVATEVGEQITTYQLLGKRQFFRGKIRQNTKQGKKIIEKYRNLIGKDPWKELAEPSKAIGDRLMEGIFVLFRDASARANKTFLLGSLSKFEFESGIVFSGRLTALRTELGRYRMVAGMKSIIGATPEGKAYAQYKRWAIPILRTTIQNLGNLGKKITLQKVDSKAFKKSAIELYRLTEITAFVMLMFGMVRDEDDNSFTGKIINKAYREATTLIQALQPSMFLTAGRTASFVEKLGVSLTLILQGEKYKTTDEYKGIKKLKRQFTPVAVSQFSGGGAGDLWDRRLRKHKAKLNKIKDDFDKAKDKATFQNKHREELRALRRANELQGELNEYRKRINRIKSRKETKAGKLEIQRLEKRRTDKIKNHLKRY